MSISLRAKWGLAAILRSALAIFLIPVSRNMLIAKFRKMATIRPGTGFRYIAKTREIYCYFFGVNL